MAQGYTPPPPPGTVGDPSITAVVNNQPNLNNPPPPAADEMGWLNQQLAQTRQQRRRVQIKLEQMQRDQQAGRPVDPAEMAHWRGTLDDLQNSLASGQRRLVELHGGRGNLRNDALIPQTSLDRQQAAHAAMIAQKRAETADLRARQQEAANAQNDRYAIYGVTPGWSVYYGPNGQPGASRLEANGRPQSGWVNKRTGIYTELTDKEREQMAFDQWKRGGGAGGTGGGGGTTTPPYVYDPIRDGDYVPGPGNTKPPPNQLNPTPMGAANKSAGNTQYNNVSSPQSSLMSTADFRSTPRVDDGTALPGAYPLTSDTVGTNGLMNVPLGVEMPGTGLLPASRPPMNQSGMGGMATGNTRYSKHNSRTAGTPPQTQTQTVRDMYQQAVNKNKPRLNATVSPEFRAQQTRNANIRQGGTGYNAYGGRIPGR